MIITHISRKKSLAKGWLVYRRDWFDKIFEIISTLIFCLFPLSFLYIYIAPIERLEPNWFIIASIFSYVLYFLYRKIVELRLIIVKTGIEADKAIPVLIKFFNERGWTNDEYEEHVIIFEKTRWYSPRKHMTTFIEDDRLHFCLLQFSSKINPPTLVSHLFLKRDLEKMFKQDKLS